MPHLNLSGFKSVIIGLPLLLIATLSLTGCQSSPQNGGKDVDKEKTTVKMLVVQIDQLAKLAKKIPDGQYLVAKVSLENTSTKSIKMKFDDFTLGNITDKDEERYSQPLEKGMTWPLKDMYGEAVSSKTLDYQPFSLYPHMQVERYFVFMVPSNAKLNGYQITYTPQEVSTPLVTTGITKVYDHRNESERLIPE